MSRDSNEVSNGTLRTLEFWRRAGGIYAGYKVAQTKAWLLSLQGRSHDAIQHEHWHPHHMRAGQDMYRLCIDLKGFFLKAGQFLGSRADFVPKEICEQLCKLQDQVPPMPATQVERLLKEELSVRSLDELFEWIDLDKPLGSASIAQVHKAQLLLRSAPPKRSSLRRILSSPATGLAALIRVLRHAPPTVQKVQPHVVQPGESAWTIANEHGIGLPALQRANVHTDLLRIAAGQEISLPVESDATGDESFEARRQRSVGAVDKVMSSPDAPPDGIVAVKVQYPSSLPLMQQDLGNLRGLATFLSKTELPFDLVSAVDELNVQIRLEFDFTREARVMDSIAVSLRNIRERVVVPTSIPGLVTRRAIVMSFVDGVPLNELSSRMQSYSELQRRMAAERILSRVSEAYGRMILGSGLFQADGHPGNIMVMKGGRVGLLDYGQSKQLTDDQRLQVARLIIALCEGDEHEISRQMSRMMIKTSLDDAGVRSEMGYGMFDTRGRVDPFDKDSPMRKAAINNFPSEYFFVLRVVQLLRGMSAGMGLEFSSAKQWRPWAEEALA